MCQEFDVNIDPKIIPRIAFGFAGGIGNTGAVCGALAGGVMAISLMMEQGKQLEDGLSALHLIGEYRRRYEAQMNAITCRELTGADLTTLVGINEYMKSDIPKKVCFPSVGVAYDLAVDLLRETSAPSSAKPAPS